MPTGRDYVRSWGCANLTPAMRRGFLFEGWYRPLSVVSEISNQTLDARLAHSSELALIGTDSPMSKTGTTFTSFQKLYFEAMDVMAPLPGRGGSARVSQPSPADSRWAMVAKPYPCGRGRLPNPLLCYEAESGEGPACLSLFQ